MIKDRLENSNLYHNLSENLSKGFSWLQKNDLKNLKDGKYDIDGNKIYASIQTYETKEDAKYEAHRKYIDIQYIVNGEEKIGVTDLSNCISCTNYDESKDIEFFDIEKKDEYLDLDEGYFMILYPQDAHKPSISKDKTSTVKKVVVKVAID